MNFHRPMPEVTQDADLGSDFFESSFNLSFLAQETMELSTKFSDVPSDGPGEKPQLSSGPGLVYRLEKSGGTFCLRAIACENLRETWALVQEDGEYFPRLKISSPEQLHDLRFYPLERIEYGEVIVDLLANRRYPYVEDMLCNLSDPGPSWYLSKSTDCLQIFFKSPSLSQGKNLINIGPIGDKKIAQMRWAREVSIWHHLLHLQESRIDDKGIYLRPLDPTHPILHQLRTLFLEGELSPQLDQLLGERKESLQLYCQELAYGRKFWRTLEAEIGGQLISQCGIASSPISLL